MLLFPWKSNISTFNLPKKLLAFLFFTASPQQQAHPVSPASLPLGRGFITPLTSQLWHSLLLKLVPSEYQTNLQSNRVWYLAEELLFFK
jgi:hypothetical protein